MRYIGILGLLLLLTVAYLMSNNKKAVKIRLVLWGLGLQLIFAFLIMRTGPGRFAFKKIAEGVTYFQRFADEGSVFVFGNLAKPETFGFIFAFKVLPLIIFISSFFTVLYYLGIMQKVVLVMAKIMAKTMKVSGAESLSAAANVFMGQTEAPILIAPYIPAMTLSELLCVMTGGMATVSGAILLSYVSLGVRAEYLLAGSVMAAPAAVLMSKLFLPETEVPKTAGSVKLEVQKEDVNVIDAAARGAATGVRLAINVGGMLIAFIALIALLNGLLSWASVLWTRWTNLPVDLTLNRLFGYAFSPLAFLLGVPWSESRLVGGLFGTKLVINEFVAYVNLATLLKDPAVHLSPRSEIIASYALCGFANFSSIGIQLGGIGGLAPGRRHDLARLGLRAVMAGSMATYMTAAIAGLLGG
ncbi:MAG: NupC/NupG family nucleoside CNT transporter [Acidobacteria bacterium]|nr:NupC/NupG family nucleoside CNT transporter [Acidobacteriota bacterium]